ncbi:siderophore-iron reductase FhuF [Pseudomonas sp. MYb187]|uniref:siderophore-iron reductase FhuF n=1 Tax=Pseudomonas TaxID=286 RepID=UPI000CFC2880|nr:siderophore-iron reductase FhuF [Pseudomonas sp. MYb187]PRA66379.1 siderophore-iron reductase FhuF [Pseudomonas sp. MYb187]
MSEPVRLDQVLAPLRFDQLLLDLYGPQLMPAQRPVLVSQWSKYYFAAVWQTLLGDARLPVFAEAAVALDVRGLPTAFSGQGRYCEGLDEAIGQHLEPLVQRLATLGAVSPAVLWGNAGDCLDQMLQQAGGDVGLGRLLTTPGSPLFAAVSLGASGKRRRRTCCLSYKVDWVGHCEHCPLAD